MRKSFLDLGEDLTIAIQNLQGSSFAYDNGFIGNSLSIATSIRTMFHQTSASESLIKQVCDLENRNFGMFKMVSSKRLHDPNTKLLLFDGSMCHIHISDQTVRFLPNLYESPLRELTLSEWWNEPVIRDVRNGFDNPIWYSRRDLIVTHANKEGGAHFDPSKSKLNDIGMSKAVGWQYRNALNEISESIPNQKTASIRQIAFEVLRSLYLHYPKFFGERYF